MNTATLAALGAAAGAALLALWDRWQDPEDEDVTTEAAFVALAAAVVVQYRARAVALADAALAAFRSVDTGAAVPAAGLSLPDGTEGAARAGVVDLLADVTARHGHLDTDAKVEAARERVAAHARADALATAQDTYGGAMADAPEVTGWTRVLNSGACKLCQDLAGDVLPVSARMYHHPGCGCTQRPITTTRR